MKIAILTAHGYLSFTDEGKIEYRPTIGPWEVIDLISQEPAPTPEPISFNCPKGTDFSNFSDVEGFIKHARVIAFGGFTDDVISYWEGKKQEMLDRGDELGMTPRELYYWERMIGRGAGATDTAKFGPYAGLIDSNESLVS